MGETCDQNFKKLETLIEALTHSGLNNLDESTFKEIKKICKSSQIYIPKAYEYLMKQLKKKNSQIRHLAFMICDELFRRSALFRELIIKDLQLIFKLTAEINSKTQLPPPISSAKRLKILALSTLQNWVKDFGETYNGLNIAYNYLKNVIKVNFNTFEVETSAERVAENELQARQRVVQDGKIKKLLEDIENNEPEILNTITSLSTCLNLLMPTLEDFFISDSNLTSNNQSDLNYTSEFKEDETSQNELRPFGINYDYNLAVEINPSEKFKIPITDENSSIIENAKDCVVLIKNRFLPMIKKSSLLLCKSDSHNSQEIKKILDLKEKLDKILDKYNKLSFEGNCSNKISLKEQAEVQTSEDEDDIDFEEVKKEGYEENVNFSEEDFLSISSENHLSKQKQSNVIQKNTIEPCASTSFLDQANKQPRKVCSAKTPTSTESERKKKLLNVAPKLPFDIDLYHWEDENLVAPTLVSTKIDVDKFWGSAGSDDIHEIPNPEGMAALRTRVIEFTGKFEPVKWSCRAPLPNGNLCPRKDRIKCPFHGKIVPRDSNGKCQNPEDAENESQTTSKSLVPDWQDPELLRDLKDNTGIDLKMPSKNKKRKSKNDNLTHKKMRTSAAALKIAKSKNFPGLVDVVRKKNNAYSRLSKKVFNKSSLKRVSAVLNKLDRNRYKDKFGDQFNY